MPKKPLHQVKKSETEDFEVFLSVVLGIGLFVTSIWYMIVEANSYGDDLSPFLPRAISLFFLIGTLIALLSSSVSKVSPKARKLKLASLAVGLIAFFASAIT